LKELEFRIEKSRLKNRSLGIGISWREILKREFELCDAANITTPPPRRLRVTLRNGDASTRIGLGSTQEEGRGDRHQCDESSFDMVKIAKSDALIDCWNNENLILESCCRSGALPLRFSIVVENQQGWWLAARTSSVRVKRLVRISTVCRLLQMD
jgi:hypothetical protein